MPRSARHNAMLKAMGLPVFARASPPATSQSARAGVPIQPIRPSAPTPSGPRPATPARARAVTSGPGAAVATLGWDDLRSAVRDCRACALCESRQQTVFGAGSTQAQWMIVGEAPGEHEDAQGEPFVGRAGQLLDAMLRAINLTRGDAPSAAQQVYIANTIKCRPPRNRNPLPDELAACEPFLLRQIELVQPHLIVAMGRYAVQSLLRTDEAIGRLRGRVHQFEGRPLVVTYHPAYLLRNPIDKARAWEDLCLAASVAASAPT